MKNKRINYTNLLTQKYELPLTGTGGGGNSNGLFTHRDFIFVIHRSVYSLQNVNYVVISYIKWLYALKSITNGNPELVMSYQDILLLSPANRNRGF